MGLFGKIKNILFEDDDELVEDMPVYTKEDVEEKKEEEKKEPEVVVQEPITTTDHSRFSNVKRDVYMDFEDDVLDEVASAPAKEEFELPKKAEVPPMPEPVKEEKKSPFLSFDEDEFTRLNSRVNRSDNRVRREEPKREEAISVARKANNNFSSTTTQPKESQKYQINSGTLATGKKPFTPSPVISPVYGILGENYKKDDIVDKKDGMKREPVVKPALKQEVKEEIQPKKEEPVKVNIDSVRQKAYGSLSKLEEAAEQELEEDNSVREKPIEPRIKAVDKVSVGHPLDSVSVKEEPIPEEIKEMPIPKQKEVVKEEVSVEDQLEQEEPIDVSKILDEVESTPEVEEDDDIITRPMDQVVEKKEKKPQKLDDLEKTSTLQILDDIEKELNSIKPISKVQEPLDVEEDKDMKTKLENNDTLENDLFNLIDSMYEEGEEEDNG